MKRLGKKLTSVMLVLVMIFSVIPTMAFAASDVVTNDTNNLSGNTKVETVKDDYESDVQTGEKDVSAALTFKAYINGTEVASSKITKTENGYTGMGNYSKGNVTVDLYTITVPKGTENVTFKFSSGCLAYEYKDASTWVGPWYDASIAYGGPGITETTIAVDSDNDGVPCFVQVQDVYTSTYENGDLRYAITFKYAADSDEKQPVDNKSDDKTTKATKDKTNSTKTTKDKTKASVDTGDSIPYGTIAFSIIGMIGIVVTSIIIYKRRRNDTL